MKRVLVLCIVLIAATTAPMLAQEMTIEAPSGAQALGVCDHVHVIDGSSACAIGHIERKLQIGEATQVVQLDGRDYAVNWTGPGFYLEGGLVIQASGDVESINGQQWLEVAPQSGRTHSSSHWNDVDGNGALSLADSIVIDGQTLRVKDVRLQARVSPLLQ